MGSRAVEGAAAGELTPNTPPGRPHARRLPAWRAPRRHGRARLSFDAHTAHDLVIQCVSTMRPCCLQPFSWAGDAAAFQSSSYVQQWHALFSSWLGSAKAQIQVTGMGACMIGRRCAQASKGIIGIIQAGCCPSAAAAAAALATCSRRHSPLCARQCTRLHSALQ